jgi:3-deoxy-manno-octulosonate cytidylyltransferase (CMP-KDO synthetase)
MADVRQAGEGPCCIIIPARFASTRFPGKPLARLRGAGGTGRTLIERSWLAARAALPEVPLFVATDDERIASEVERFGGAVIDTPAGCRNGTERCAAALEMLGDRFETIINLQGDALLTPAHVLQALHRRMEAAPDLPVATPAIPANSDTLRHLLEDQREGRVGGTTIIRDAHGDALYFSKSVLPHGAEAAGVQVHLHLGVYAYRASALLRYLAAPPCDAENAEGLEQLRFLDQAIRVAVVDCSPPEGLTAELNNPEDLPLIEAELARRGID